MSEAADFVALQRLVDECRKGTLFEDYDEACAIVADAQVALLAVYERAGRPVLNDGSRLTRQDVIEGHDGTHGPCPICGYHDSPAGTLIDGDAS
jgi:hypothetical protein